MLGKEIMKKEEMEKIEDEPIKNLLMTTGWTLSDLLGKLQKYQNPDESNNGLKTTDSINKVNPKKSAQLNIDIIKSSKNKYKVTDSYKKNKNQNLSEDNKENKRKYNKYTFVKSLKSFRYIQDFKKHTLLKHTFKTLQKYKKQHFRRKQKRIGIIKNEILAEKPKKNIRDKIKEQLDLLRNRKNTFLSFVVPSESPTPQPIIRKQSTKISDLLLEKICNRTVNENCSPDNSESSTSIRNHSTDLFQSTSSDFVITNVIGGYDFPDDPFISENVKDEKEKLNQHNDDNKENEQNLTYINEELESKAICPTKTKDVKKIKGWQKKKFVVRTECSKETESNDCQIVYNSSPVASVSSCNITHIYSNINYNKTADTDGNIESINIEGCDKSNINSSVFVSDSLDQYLNENSKLNISYEVPKLIAEESVTKRPLHLPVLYSKTEIANSAITKVKSETGYKPKTLAEKRKILAGQLEMKPKIEKKFNNLAKSNRKQTFVPLSEFELKEENKINDEVYKDNINLNPRDCFSKKLLSRAKNKSELTRIVIYNKTKLTVVSKSRRKVVERIIDNFLNKTGKDSEDEMNSNVKPSLLKALENKKDHVKYKPGPLCHKNKLQTNLRSEWKTSIFKLPQVFVEIEPTFRKEIHPRVRELINKDNEIILNEDKVSFALTALGSVENPPKCTVRFPIPYANNQKSILVRKKINHDKNEKEVDPVIPFCDEQRSLQEIVENIVDRMINYVECKEIESVLNKVDPDFEESYEKEGIVPPSPIDTNISTIIKKPSYNRRMTKTALELKRLNVKVIEVNVENPEDNNVKCTNDYCKLGCICLSLQCNPSFLVQNHCGLEKCMLNCTCKTKKNEAEKQLTLPIGTNILSTRVVNHLQDVATKDLAKVEKEFTQTVIKANNQTIVVGTDNKRRLRRTLKTPIRYGDYVHEYVPEIGQNGQSNSKDIVVNLIKYDLNMIPFCLIHELYNCVCLNIERISAAPQKNLIVRRKTDGSENFDIDVSRNTKYNEMMKNNCSRTKSVASDYYLQRNRSTRHKQKIKQTTKKLFLEKNNFFNGKEKKFDSEEDSYFENYDSEESKDSIFTEKKLSGEASTRKSKRKQTLTELVDLDNANKKQKLEKNVKKLPNSSSKTTKSLSPKKANLKLSKRSSENNEIDVLQYNKMKDRKIPKPIEYDLLQDLRSNKKDLGKNMCLMSWKTLRSKFQNYSLFIWQSKLNSEILITNHSILPDTNFIEIKTLITKDKKKIVYPNPIVRWLLIGLPVDKLEDNLLVILSMGENHCKICGVCEKLENSKKFRLIETSPKESYTALNIPFQIDLTTAIENKLTNSSLTTEVEDKLVVSSSKIKKNENESTNSSTTNKAEDKSTTPIRKRSNNVCVNVAKDKNDAQDGKKRVLFFSRHKFSQLNLIPELKKNLLKSKQTPVKIRLPYITGGCRWRFIELENPFSFLYFVRSNYSIRYVDLIKGISMISESDMVIHLKSLQMKKNYKHHKFGIFCMSENTRKVFVGPYAFEEDHDVDILTYVNNVLVNTDLYNKVAGLPETGSWFYQFDDTKNNTAEENDNEDVQIIQTPPTCIDLTSDNEEEVKNEDKSSDSRSTLITFQSEQKLIKSNSSTNDNNDKEQSLEINKKQEENSSLPNSEINAKLSNQETTSIKQIGQSILKRNQVNINKSDDKTLNEPPPLTFKQFFENQIEISCESKTDTKKLQDKCKNFAYNVVKLPTIRKSTDSTLIISPVQDDNLNKEITVTPDLKDVDGKSQLLKSKDNNCNFSNSPELIVTKLISDDKIVKPIIPVRNVADPSVKNSLIGKKLTFISKKKTFNLPPPLFKSLKTIADKSTNNVDGVPALTIPVNKLLHLSTGIKRISIKSDNNSVSSNVNNTKIPTLRKIDKNNKTKLFFSSKNRQILLNSSSGNVEKEETPTTSLRYVKIAPRPC